jgi:hypothetical protein
VAKNGYYILTEKSKVLPPYIPWLEHMQDL